MDAPAAPADDDDWVAVTGSELPAGEAGTWVVRPSCGAAVTFTGTSRDHSRVAGVERRGVTVLEYEAYDDHVVTRLRAVAGEARRRWPALGRVAILHRVGRVAVGEASVVVAVSAPHRDEAFAAARFAIDAVKATVPVWKREVWGDGSAWGLDGHAIEDVSTWSAAEAESGGGT